MVRRRLRSGLERPLPTIVIVDDQSTGRRLLAELMRQLDSDVRVVDFGDAEQALAWAGGEVADLVLTDYKMPRLDGIGFTRQLRELPGYREVPVVMITVVEDKSICYEALEAGATDFLTKPLDHYECLARCRNLLTLRRQQRIIADRAAWLEQQVRLATQQILERERETLLRLARAGEHRDEDTGNHVLRVAQFSRLIAEGLGLQERECEVIECAAPMHDIGKIGISDTILLKNGRHTPEEREVMKRHSVIGYEILKDSPSQYLQSGAVVALNHHERYDGGGYPRGLAGTAIPQVARIVAVADVYDALTCVRPYKQAWPSERAFDLITSERAGHFDPDCVDIFLADRQRVLDIQARLADSFPNVAPRQEAADG
jgi:two-component system response regulator RpfG